MEAMRKDLIKEIQPLKVCASLVGLLRVGSRGREGWELRKKPLWPTLGSGTADGA